jgi:LysM repeat protein
MASCLFTYSQQNQIIRNYIDSYSELAISEMQRTGVPASIKLAQGIHETMAGTSVLVTKSNNHFGIKCKANWKGESVSHDDDARGECFRKYPAALDSYKDHSDFLKNGPRYASLFTLDPTDYKGWANGLKKAGYATNPKYPIVLIKLIEDYGLQDYTMIALGKMPPQQQVLASEVTTAPETVEALANINNEPEIKSRFIKEDYPDGVFKINETKVIFVQKGTSFLSLAQQHNISLSRLFEFNDLNASEVAATDQLIYLQRKRKTGKSEFHTIQPGETLHDIAQIESIRLESLMEYNGLTPGMQPAVGEKLSLRTRNAVTPRMNLKADYSIKPAGKGWN